jgi:DNA-binding transcriptional LysR family regulator
MGAGEEDLLEVKLLLLFDVLYTTGSVTRAAELLGLSQPTASLWLGQLRRRTGDPLFVRSPTGMRPTPHAERLVGTVRTTLAAVRELGAGRSSFDAAHSDRRFWVHMTDGSHVVLLPRLFGHISRIAPGVGLVVGAIEERTADALRSGAVDLALGFAAGLEHGFRHQALYRQEWVCLVRRDHPRVEAAMSAAEYSAEAHVAVGQGTGAALLTDTLEALTVERRVQLEVPGVLGLPAVLASSDLVATVPRHIGESLAQQGGLRLLPCPVAVPGFVVRQYWHPRHEHDVGHQWLRGVVAELFLQEATRGPGSAGAPAVSGAPGSRERSRGRT